MVWAAVCLRAIPLVVYVVSYIPWALIENHQLWPAGRPGPHRPDPARPDRPDVRLPQRPDRAAPGVVAVVGVAVRPQARVVLPGLVAGTTAAIYDAGNLVIWWMGVPALAFVASRPSPAQPRARPHRRSGSRRSGCRGRASTAPRSSTTTTRPCRSSSSRSPTSWPSCGTGRRAGRGCGPASRPGWPSSGRPLMWLLSRPLCAFVGVESVNPGSAACPAVIPDIVLTLRTVGARRGGHRGRLCSSARSSHLGAAGRRDGVDATAGARSAARSSACHRRWPSVRRGGAPARDPDLHPDGVPVEPIAIIVGLPLGYLGAQVVAARDARRYVVGLLAAVGWFAIAYPNISALPLPSARRMPTRGSCRPICTRSSSR